MDTNTPETTREAQILQRLNAATPGPWVNHWKEDRQLGEGPDYREDIAISSDAPNLEGVDRMVVGMIWYDGPNTAVRVENAELIANAPTDIAWLLAELATTRTALTRAEEADKWIPVTERLPEPGRQVLLYFAETYFDPEYSVELGYFCQHEDGTYHWGASEALGAEYITHWKPVPAGPPPPAPACNQSCTTCKKGVGNEG